LKDFLYFKPTNSVMMAIDKFYKASN